MRFIHAADIHLDSPLHGLSAYPDAPAEQLRNASREAFTLLVDQAIAEAVDFMVIAGDLYDGDWRDHNTGIFFVKEMGKLRRAGIPVYVVFGNHDAESEMSKRLLLPDNVHVFGSGKPQSFRIDRLKVALHGQSFKQKETLDNLAAGYPLPVPGHYNIGVLHTALEGNAAHANYAPCSLAELQAKGYAYWALGHVHEFAHWPASGPGTADVVFPGNLQGRNIRETGRRGAVVVDVDADGHTRVERLFVDVLRWERLEVDASGHPTLAEVVRDTGRRLEALLDEDAGVPRAVRVSVVGRSAAHGELFGRAAQLRQEILAQIAAIGNERLWLEKVRVETAPAALPQDAAAHPGALAELSDIFAQAHQDPGFLELLKNDLDALAAKAPLDLQASTPVLQAIREGRLAELVQSVAPGLLGYLAQEE